MPFEEWLAADPERRRRFEHEARAASALNHPHICTLHDIGSQASPTGAGPPVDYLVMEHLEGRTLAARLAKGKLQLAQALEIGIQVAHGLSAAHKHGIVHRDLKPANVMLVKGHGGSSGTGGLQAKPLDFGLAKLRTPHPSGDLASELAAEPASVTAPGMLLGTLPYMAPEQVEGKDADARTDLWALGVLLYEMLTGTRAFEGTSAASLIGNIMKAEPPSLATAQPQTPPALDRLIKHCLAKDPEARWDTAHDVADELRWVQDSTVATRVTEAPPRRARRRMLGWMVALVVVGTLASAAVTSWLWLRVRPSATPAPVIRTELGVQPAETLNAGGVVPLRLLTPGGSRTALTWTPDGQALVFVGRQGDVQQLYVRRLNAMEAVPLKGTEGAQVPAVSADGRQVAFWAGGAIKKVPFEGGIAVDLVPRVVPPWGLAWDTGGRLFFGRYDDFRIWAISSEGTPAAVTTVGEEERAHTLPSPLPGGRVLLYTVRKRFWSWGGRGGGRPDPRDRQTDSGAHGRHGCALRVHWPLGVPAPGCAVRGAV